MPKSHPDLFGPPLQAPDGAPVYTVTEVTRAIKDTLETHLARVWITGEITNLRRPASGHCYFTLKDNFAQITVVIWRSSTARLKFDLQDGLAVILQGELTVYEPRGQYQVIARRVEPLGVGALQLAFTQLKEKLAQEGLFDPERKQPLPLIPRRIALVTSATGAAVHDMLNVIFRRMPNARVLVCPVRVQGNEAPAEIAGMIARVNDLPEIDVIVVGRGGGSFEDLQPFNEEIVARAIAASRIPIVSAVGHETDFTIADFVADLRALTPTDAGTRIVPDVRQLTEHLGGFARRLGQTLLARIAAAKAHLNEIARQLAPRRTRENIRAREQRLDDLAQRLYHAITHCTALQKQRMQAAGARLESLSPLAVLSRGYSLTCREADGAVVRDPAGLNPGDIILTRVHRGEFRASVIAAAPPTPPQKTPDHTKNSPARKKATSRKRRPNHGA